MYVTVSFGDKANTTYKIHVVKVYKGLIPIIALAIALLIALIIMAYFISKYNKTKKELKAERVAAKADKFRITEEEGPQMSVNGVSATGIGARVVKPKAIEVNSIKRDEFDRDSIRPERVNEFEREEIKPHRFDEIERDEIKPHHFDEVDREPSKIVEARPNTIPGMVPPKEEKVEEKPKTPSQVKVVKRIVNPTTGEVRFITVTQKVDE